MDCVGNEIAMRAAWKFTVRRRPIARRLTLIFAAILWFAPVIQGSLQVADSSKYDNSPVRDNPYEQQWLRSRAKENQERFRLRISLPRNALDTSLSMPAAPSPTEATEPEIAPDGSITPSAALFLFLAACLAGLLLALRKLGSPIARKREVRPATWISKPNCVPDTRSDDKVFAEFMVDFNTRRSSLAAPQPLKPATLEPAQAGSNPAVSELGTRFFSVSPQQLLAMRNALHAVRKEDSERAQVQMLHDLRSRLSQLTTAASLPELHPIWQVASVAEGLVGQLVNRNSAVHPSTLRTVASSLDLLIDLCARGPKSEITAQSPFRILAADDDLLCRHAVALGLKKAFNKPELAASSETALVQSSTNPYDVIFLDIMMPGMNGFELCSKIRKTPVNRLTPVVFVTALNDLDSRAKSSLCGGNDFIPKPFLTYEIAAKAMVLGMRRKMDTASIQSTSVSLA